MYCTRKTLLDMENKQEQILVRITGQDRPGLTASIMGILAKYDAQILDIGQADIHSTLSSFSRRLKVQVEYISMPPGARAGQTSETMRF